MEATYSASINATKNAYIKMQHQSARVDELLTDIADLSGQILSLNAQLTAVQNGVESNTESLKASIEQLAAASIEETNKKVSDNIEELKEKAKSAVDTASQAGIDSFYTHWGSASCKRLAKSTKLKNPTKRYNGWLFGTQHNHRGGGNTNKCMIDKSGSNGGYRTGGYDDMMRPIRLESTNHVTGPMRNVNSRIIPCSTCHYPKKCYHEWGLASCKKEGYSPMYEGWMYGAYHNHHGNNERVCIDKNIQTSEWTNRGYYAGHMYPTQTQDATGKRSGGTFSLNCLYCCQDN